MVTLESKEWTESNYKTGANGMKSFNESTYTYYSDGFRS